VSELELELRAPTEARRDGNLRRSLSYIREHLGEPLRLTDVARVGGFAPAYYSQLFKQRERVPFEKYVERLRVERAKQLLLRTEVSVASVARLCGFASASYFHRVFKRRAGVTPAAYIKKHGSRARSARRRGA
jgi:YesN/AraC family two-component response regulator